MKIDLDALHYDAHRCPVAACPSDHLMCMPTHSCVVTRLALITRIRELEVALRIVGIGGLVGHITADKIRTILEKGAVLP